MKTLLVICFSLLVATSCLGIRYDIADGTRSFFKVTSYGAVGDGETDDSQAFIEAWRDVCGATKGNPTLDIPPGKTFMLKPLSFVGPCNSNSVHIQIRGNVIAPKSTWSSNNLDSWIRFSCINGLTINGGGQIDGQGSLWWRSCDKKVENDLDLAVIMDADFGGWTCQNRPTAVHFHNCNDLQLSCITHMNSPRNHISINECNDVKLFNLHIVAPEESPNTDGIDISASANISIQDSLIQTGDDCVAINSGSSFINIAGVSCGPGHGISIGSLGANGDYATVEEIHVRNCTLKGTTNGARIKTWQGGSGYARRISFQQINLIGSRNPIIINQYYHDDNKKDGGIQVSDITYSQVQGTSADDVAIQFSCNEDIGCSNIVMRQVNISSATGRQETYAVCSNVQGTSTSVTPIVPCLTP